MDTLYAGDAVLQVRCGYCEQPISVETEGELYAHPIGCLLNTQRQLMQSQAEITRLRTPMECGHVEANRGEDGACVVCEQIRGVCAGYTGGCFCDFLGVSECPVHGD